MKKIFTLLCISILAFRVYGQDPQLSQYYSAPLHLNPALTGAGDCYRSGLLYRSQWSGLGKPFSTVTGFVDLNYSAWNSGIGLIVTRDDAGNNYLSTTEAALSYRYVLALNKKNSLSFGLQGGYAIRKIDYSNTDFEDQYTNNQLAHQQTIDPVSNTNRTGYANLNAGLLLYGDNTYWIGISAFHLNKPSIGFNAENDRLPIRYSVQGGYKISFNRSLANRNKDAFVLTPTFMYKHQGKYDQLDLGAYFIQQSILVGLWYRGVIVKEEKNIRNNDAIIFHVGYKHKAVALIYSYDATLSNLSLRNTHGSHEISLTYDFCLSWPPQKRIPKRAKRLPCPSFLK